MTHQKMKKENNRFDRELAAVLNPEERERLNRLQIHLRASSLTRNEQETVRKDLLNKVAAGLSRGDSLDAIIGQDDKAFMEGVIADFDRKGRPLLDREMIRGLFLGLALLFLLKALPEIMFSLFSTPLRDWQTGLVPAHILTGFLLLAGGMLAVRHLTNHAFAARHGHPGFIAIYVLLFLLILAINLVLPLPDWTLLFHPFWLVLAACGCFAVARLIP